MNSDALFTRNTYKTYPRFIRGDHIYLYSDTGERFIDGASGTVIANIGHGRSEIAKAMANQSEKLAFASPVVAVNEPAEKLAYELVSLSPSSITKCWYQTSGSEAVEAAIKLSRVAHLEAGRMEKYLIVGRWQSYHGTTLGSLSATGHTPRRAPFHPLLLPFQHIPHANCYRCHFNLLPDTCSFACAHALESKIKHIGPEIVSAFITEPIVGSGAGVTFPPQGYFEIIREICDKYNVYWIVDEIMTGFWRTGPSFAFQHWTAVPDIIVFAKGVTAGYAALSGLLANKNLYNLIKNGRGTFNSAGTMAGNPVSCAVGLKVLEIARKENIPERVTEIGSYFYDRLSELNQFNFVGDVRGKGLLAAVEFVQDKETAKPFPLEFGLTGKIVNAAYEKKLIIYGSSGIADGINGDIIMVAPPLTTSKDEIDEIVDCLTNAIDVVSKQLE